MLLKEVPEERDTEQEGVTAILTELCNNATAWRDQAQKEVDEKVARPFWFACVDHCSRKLLTMAKRLEPFQLFKASVEMRAYDNGMLTPAINEAITMYRAPENQPVELTTFPEFITDKDTKTCSSLSNTSPECLTWGTTNPMVTSCD